MSLVAIIMVNKSVNTATLVRTSLGFMCQGGLMREHFNLKGMDVGPDRLPSRSGSIL